MKPLFLLIFTALFLCISCENNIDDVRRITFNPKSPDETISKFRLVYNEGSKARVELYANLAETFNKPEKITYIRDSLKVNFFSETGEKVATLTAKSGQIDLSKNEIMVKDSVQLYNYKKKQLMKTEILYWRQKDSLIFTNRRVIVTSPKGYMTGSGFKTKQDFSWYEILKPQGNVMIEKNEELN